MTAFGTSKPHFSDVGPGYPAGALLSIHGWQLYEMAFGSFFDHWF